MNYFFFNAVYVKAVRWFAKLFALTSDFASELYYRYAQALKYIGETDKANELIKEFELRTTDDVIKINFPLKNTKLLIISRVITLQVKIQVLKFSAIYKAMTIMNLKS